MKLTGVGLPLSVTFTWKSMPLLLVAVPGITAQWVMVMPVGRPAQAMVLVVSVRVFGKLLQIGRAHV